MQLKMRVRAQRKQSTFLSVNTTRRSLLLSSRHRLARFQFKDARRRVRLKFMTIILGLHEIAVSTF